jgi:REP element-mobilizing transposase RayT
MERLYRRRLPHWRVDAPGVVYCVTWRLAEGGMRLVPAERETVAEALRHWEGTRFRSDAWVVMDDHVHVVGAPLTSEPLETLVHSWKSFSAHRLMAGGRAGPVWQHEPFDRLVRSDLEFARTILYVCSNPLKRWPELTDYRWVWPELRQLA